MQLGPWPPSLKAYEWKHPEEGWLGALDCYQCLSNVHTLSLLIFMGGWLQMQYIMQWFCHVSVMILTV